MDDNTLFTVDKNSPIWIYGHGFLGVPLYARFLKAGFRVLGFIDKNAPRLAAEHEYTVISPEQIELLDPEDIVIVSFQNIQEQEKVVQKLLGKGLHRIIYLKENTEYYPKTFDIFNSIVYGNQEEGFDFPYTFSVMADREPYSRCYSDFVVTDVPVQLLFSAKLQGPIGLTGDDPAMIWHYNIASTYEYNSIFRLFLYGRMDAPYYARYRKRLHGKGRTEEEFVDNRYSLFCRFMDKYTDHGLSAFRNEPSHAYFDRDSGRFILDDGHHRAAFLANIGQTMIPVRMCRTDYEIWENRDCAERVRALLSGQKELSTPVLNPLFSDRRAKTEQRGMLAANSIAEFFNSMDLSNISVLDVQADLGYYSRVFARLGARNIIAFESRPDLAALGEAINRLEYAEHIRQTDTLPDRRFDVVLCCNDEAADGVPSGENGVLIARMAECCGRWMLLKLGGDMEARAERIRTACGFARAEVLCHRYEDYTQKGVVIFERE